MKILLLAVVISLLSGCSQVPYQDEINYDFDTQLITSEDEKNQVSYLARYLKDYWGRALLEKKIHTDPEIIREIDAEIMRQIHANSSRNAVKRLQRKQESELALRSLGYSSSEIGGIQKYHGYGELASVFFRKRSAKTDSKQVSKFYLPNKVEGIEITTKQEAMKAAHRIVESQLAIFAEEKGYRYRCVGNCNGDIRVYEFEPESQATYAPYHYRPTATDTIINFGYSTNLHAIVGFYYMQKAGYDPVIASTLGFEPAWETGSVNSFRVGLATGCQYNPNTGELNIQQRELKYKYAVSPTYDMVTCTTQLPRTQIGREFFNIVFAEGVPAYHFTKSHQPKIGYFNGKAYSWQRDLGEQFIDRYADLSVPVFEE